jgi:hypothetical protein
MVQALDIKNQFEGDVMLTVGIERRFVLVSLLAFLLGCGEGVVEPNWPDTVPCEGTVTLNGKPLTETQVLFIPDASTTGQGASGTTDASGKYSLSSRNGKGEIVKGIIPGKYRVAFSRMVKPDGSVWVNDPANPVGPATVGAREELPMKLSDPANSLQLAEVKGGGAPVDFTLKK